MLKANDDIALLSLAERVARRAGALLKEVSLGLQQINQEMAHDLKIKADQDAERCIIDMLSAETCFSILSEEAGNVFKGKEDLKWIVDPLDGTINFLRHIPISCVSIGMWKGEAPILGVVFDFNRDELFKGQVSQGAWLNNARIHVSDVKEKQKAILLTGFPAKADLSDDALARFVSNVQGYRKVRWIGSAALSLVYVACGR